MISLYGVYNVEDKNKEALQYGGVLIMTEIKKDGEGDYERSWDANNVWFIVVTVYVPDKV